MQARERQIAENEVRFRALNERLRDASGTWNPGEGALELVCECGDENCTHAIGMTPHDYEAVRSNEAQFAVVPGHERPEVDGPAHAGRVDRPLHAGVADVGEIDLDRPERLVRRSGHGGEERVAHRPTVVGLVLGRFREGAHRCGDRRTGIDASR